jgi:hypothetical protein
VPPTDKRIRPLPGLHFTLPNKGDVELCKEPPFSESCQASSRWLQHVITVSNDLFIGRQFSRPQHPVAEPVAPITVMQPVSEPTKAVESSP